MICLKIDWRITSSASGGPVCSKKGYSGDSPKAGNCNSQNTFCHGYEPIEILRSTSTICASATACNTHAAADPTAPPLHSQQLIT